MRTVRILMMALVLAVVLGAMPFVARGDTIGPLTDKVAEMRTNWGFKKPVALSVAQFNPALGTLNSVEITFVGAAYGNTKMENKSTSSTSTVTTTVDATLELMWPDNAMSVNPKYTTERNLSVFDNVKDYAGTSGASFTTITVSNSIQRTITGSDLTRFIGVGSLSLPVTATAHSTNTGIGGNLETIINTYAGASVSVAYSYAPAAVPSPSAAMSGLALMGVLVVMRRFTRAESRS